VDLPPRLNTVNTDSEQVPRGKAEKELRLSIVKKNWNSGTYKQLELKGVIAYLLYNGCASFMGMRADK